MDSSRVKDRPPLYRLGALTLVLPFVLTACGTQPGAVVASPAQDQEPASSAGSPPTEAGAGKASATFHLAGDSFEFSPTTCLVDEEDIVVLGAGRDTRTGEVAFLDVDFTMHEGSFFGGADIELRTDRALTSPDDFYRLNPWVDDAGFDISVDGRSFTAAGAFTAHGDAPVHEGDAAQGVLEVRCDGG